MNRSTYLRLLVYGLISAVILSGISLLCLSKLSDSAASAHRADFFLFLADSIEGRISDLTLDEIQNDKELERIREEFVLHPTPRPHRFFEPGMRAARRDLPPVGARTNFWLVDKSGKVLFASREAALPTDWQSLEKPTVVHDIKARQDFFRIFQGVFVIKLAHEPEVFLVVRDGPRPGPIFFTQSLLTFATVAAALFFSLSITFFYLRRKSIEARVVLLGLERGDLKSRFQIKRFDEFGGLLLDFNRMADQIERLVSRIHETETARKNLLQELGHDLRTPLASLTTSFETLRFHFDKMTEANRAEVFEMIGAEIEYFKELLESLMTIAQLDEPHYKESTRRLNLTDLLAQEVKVRQNAKTGKKVDWLLNPYQTNGDVFIMGDPHLVLRMFKNAFDNAGRHARGKVNINLLSTNSDFIEVQIIDDGPGLSEKALESFAKRRDQRTIKEGASLNFSLGLGSVIMRAIAELHLGRVEIANVVSQNEIQGAKLTIQLPKANAQQGI